MTKTRVFSLWFTFLSRAAKIKNALDEKYYIKEMAANDCVLLSTAWLFARIRHDTP